MIEPRLTRLVRVPDLEAFRRVLVDRATAGTLADIRRRAILLPSHAAAEQLRRTIEDWRLAAAPAAVILPSMLTRDDWRASLYAALPEAPPAAGGFEREVLLQAACRTAAAAGSPPPFTIRPGLITAMLEFYDGVRRHGRTVADFERVATNALERDADSDRGAVRMLEQTRFLAAAFRAYEAMLAERGAADEHVLTAAVLAAPSSPFAHVVVAVGDRAGEPAGLWPSDFDVLSRVAGLARLEVVATEAVLAAGLLDRLRRWLPEHDEIASALTAGGPVRDDRTAAGDETAAPTPPAAARPVPALTGPAGSEAPYWRARDREEELAGIVRTIKRAARRWPDEPLSRTAVVFKRPLPYVYLARQLFSSAGVPHQLFDALPLAAEPYAAALDLVFDAVDSNFARASLAALLRSPLLTFRAGRQVVGADGVSAFDRRLSDERYLADPAELARFAREWTQPAALHRAARAAAAIADELLPLREEGRPSAQLGAVLRFLRAHDRRPRGPSALVERHLRVRAAVDAALEGLRAAHARFDEEPRPFADTAALVHRWIEQQTFSPREGDDGVQLLDADAARFGDFDAMHLVGLTQPEWPESVARSIFYPASMLQDLHWPEDADVRAAERARFEDLLRAPSRRVFVSTITLEHDALVEPSPFLDDLEASGLPVERPDDAGAARIFGEDAILQDPQRADALPESAGGWLSLRLGRMPAADPRFHGRGDGAPASKYRVSTIDQYLSCPFVYLCTRVLRLAEEPDDEEALGPRAQGTFLHEVLQAFFDEWQARGGGAVTTANLTDARALFAEVAEARVAALPEADAALMRARLLGSPVAEGIGDIVLAAEASRSDAPVVERLLEFPLDGDTRIGSGDAARTIGLAAKADRLDLLEDGTFRVYDYKLTRAPNKNQVAQLPAYAAAARERLGATRGGDWRASDAAYISFGKGEHYEPLARDQEGLDRALADGEARIIRAVAGIEAGEFPPRPVEEFKCNYCAFSGVCRKDYVREP